MENKGNNSRDVFAMNLNYYVERSGKSQKELSEILDVPQPTFNEWCRGKKYPRIENIERLAEFFGVEIVDLMGQQRNPAASGVKREAIELVLLCPEEDAVSLLQLIKLYLKK